MISRQELAEIKERKKTNLYYEEKEYLQYIFLNAISKYDNFVFKGGTCLRICYGLERASEDLDFTSSLGLYKIRKMFYECLSDFSLLNIEHEDPVEKEHQGNIRFEVRFHGPLYNGRLNSANTLKIDFNKRKVYSKRAVVVSKLFSDVPLFTLSVLSEEEILSEKIRSLINRAQSRDLYDVWVLVQKGILVSKNLLDKKLKEENSKLSDLRLPSKKEYETDLSHLVLNLPDYEQVKNEVMRFIKGLK